MKLLLGDCLDKLKELEDNSVDSIVTDPPYGLSFMGKKWDYDVPSQAIWEECMRVLKPGGHILSFAGSRTYHRMAVRIEDAGFEIRDQIMWIYGSGFPKSHNIGKAFDKRGGNNHLVSEVAEKLKEARESRGISKAEADKLFCDGTTNYQWFEGRKDGVRLPDDNSFDKICNEWDELKPYQDLIKSANREVVGKYEGDVGGLGGERLGEKGGDITIASTDVAKQWEGWGTALKPAHEPIVMARKPLIGTVADNVLEYGVGGINIDGCRIATDWKAERPESWFNSGKSISGEPTYGGNLKTLTETTLGERLNDGGRFPANIILECTCEKVIEGDKGEIKYSSGSRDNVNLTHEWGYNDIQRTNYTDTGNIHTDPNCPCYILDGQSGNKKSTKRGAHNNKKTEYTNTYTPSNALYSDDNTYGDEGGASRFFYCPKASKSDRDEGLKTEEKKSRKWRDDKGMKLTGSGNPRNEMSKNIHPTVKPTELMKYLIRLVTPKGGVVLDPFMGSGSTGKAAVREGMEFIGIEREEEYYEIAKQRIENETNKRKFW
jgi:DNA modification methylase